MAISLGTQRGTQCMCVSVCITCWFVLHFALPLLFKVMIVHNVLCRIGYIVYFKTSFHSIYFMYSISILPRYYWNLQVKFKWSTSKKAYMSWHKYRKSSLLPALLDSKMISHLDREWPEERKGKVTEREKGLQRDEREKITSHRRWNAVFTPVRSFIINLLDLKSVLGFVVTCASSWSEECGSLVLVQGRKTVKQRKKKRVSWWLVALHYVITLHYVIM